MFVRRSDRRVTVPPTYLHTYPYSGAVLADARGAHQKEIRINCKPVPGVWDDRNAIRPSSLQAVRIDASIRARHAGAAVRAATLSPSHSAWLGET